MAGARVVGPYALEGEIARGAMGAVYRARRADGAVVALKVLHAGANASGDQRARFRREAELAARLVHPSIVRVHDVGAAGALDYLAMELVEGEPLSARVGRLAPLEAARLLAEVARGVEHAHSKGVLHRDLKPGNVLVRRDDGRALLTDFGVARHLESATLTRTGALVGTPSYLSPEQAAGGPATQATDVYGLGVVLYEALTGVLPHRREDLPSLLVAITSERPARPSSFTRDVPAALDALCLRALAKEPGGRPTAGELAAALEAIADGRAVARRPRRAAALGAGLVALLALAATVALTRGEGHGPRPGGVAAPTMRARASSPAPIAAAYVEPAWVRALAKDPGEGGLLEAHDALDALEEEGQPLDPRTRARALEVVADLDRRWVLPPLGPGHKAGVDRLAWITWLWLRLDPAHPVGKDRQDLYVANVIDVVSRQMQDEDPAYFVRAGRAMAAIQPRDLTAYLALAKGVNGGVFLPAAGPLLTTGLEVARAMDHPDGWGQVARARAGWLAHVAARDPARAPALAVELRALLREADALAMQPLSRGPLLVHAAEHAPPAEALDLLARAEALPYVASALAVARGRALREQGAPLPERLAAARKALVMGRGLGGQEETAAAVGLLLEVDPAEGLEEADATLAAPIADAPYAGLALRRLLVAPEGTDLAGGLADLGERLAARAALRDRSRADAALVAAALAEVRALLLAPPARAELLARLSAWAAPERLVVLDARPRKI